MYYKLEQLITASEIILKPKELDGEECVSEKIGGGGNVRPTNDVISGNISSNSLGSQSPTSSSDGNQSPSSTSTSNHGHVNGYFVQFEPTGMMAKKSKLIKVNDQSTAVQKHRHRLNLRKQATRETLAELERQFILTKLKSKRDITTDTAKQCLEMFYKSKDLTEQSFVERVCGLYAERKGMDRQKYFSDLFTRKYKVQVHNTAIERIRSKAESDRRASERKRRIEKANHQLCQSKIAALEKIISDPSSSMLVL